MAQPPLLRQGSNILDNSQEPKTVQEAIQYFSDPANVREYLIARRWPDGIVRCPRCGSDAVIFQEKYNRFQCG
jgi:hypothetical protein